jgi:hypothetical protein
MGGAERYPSIAFAKMIGFAKSSTHPSREAFRLADSNREVRRASHLVIARSVSDEAIQDAVRGPGLLRFARNDAASP